ncbi:uncharacterized protein [Blastocystis hominis]|uniref:Uncharacterized protein n=1 Tax=Blastocystis hominis TaxID=12968 RepID=D8M650_BLAHO|nr:uncharacterized protein [Blastocystis hominis]CBK23759.2 unnamed protein product [Blastocystis hominis]|eukprot:XP_012897807.1 uncharacterized protein [Blastocystis hominis]
MRIVSDPALEAVNQRIRDDWVRACALWTAEKEIREWRERLRETVAQLQAALRELDDALKVVRSSYSRAMGLCVESVEKELENGMVKDCGNGSCTLTNAMLKDFSGFSCSMMTGNFFTISVLLTAGTVFGVLFVLSFFSFSHKVSYQSLEKEMETRAKMIVALSADLMKKKAD